MFYRIIDKETKLELINYQIAEELFNLIEQNRKYLKNWLPWLDNTKNVEDINNFINFCLNGFAKKENITCTIVFEDKIIGIISFNSINWSTKTGIIGYWLSEHQTGKGIMTKSVKEYEKIGFEYLDLLKLQISCAVENKKSRSIPERLGYRNEGIIRNAENLYGKIIDHAVYGLLKQEYYCISERSSK